MAKFPVTGPVNTAQAVVVPPARKATDFRTLNCAACTAGALTGRTSGAVVAEVYRAFNNPGAPPPGYEPDKVFKVLGNFERKKKPEPKGPKFPPPVRLPGQNDNDYANEVGAVNEENALHVQVKALKHWVQGQRGAKGAQHGTVRGLVPFAAAFAWMNKQPSHTEFAVYFKSRMALTGGHWVYAEKGEGDVEFVDYQQFQTAANRPAPTKYPSCAGTSAPDAEMLVLSFMP
jgi:hypothetical protein